MDTCDSSNNNGVFTSENLSTLATRVLHEFTGYAAFTVLFGLSVAISSPCLYYLLRNWKSHSSHIIVLCFSITISAFNLVAFVLKTFSLGKHIRSLPCPTYTNITAFQFSNSASGTLISSSHIGADTLFTAIFPVVFLILNDGFLLYRLCIIWDRRRFFLWIPIFLYVVQLLFTLEEIIRTLLLVKEHKFILNSIANAFGNWVPSMAYSCGMDFIITSMIAGRLLYHHNKMKKLISGSSNPYKAIAVIFVESAVLSFSSKCLQLLGANIKSSSFADGIGLNIFFIPLCTISSNLIILRKALGLDVKHALSRDEPFLSSIVMRTMNPREIETRSAILPIRSERSTDSLACHSDESQSIS